MTPTDKKTTSSLEERIQDLEAKFAHQQYWLDQLNDVVREQGELIEILKTEIKSLKGRLLESFDQEKPPHY